MLIEAETPGGETVKIEAPKEYLVALAKWSEGSYLQMNEEGISPPEWFETLLEEIEEQVL